MPGSTRDGWDVLEVYKAAGEAIKRAREGGGPTLLEFKVHQLEGNLEGRIEANEKEKAWCPIELFKAKLTKDSVLTPKIDEKIREEETTAVQKAIDYAMSSPEPKLSEAYTDVFAEGG
jgi:pyruvate dehydrogenase E1 component alpha subunit